MTRSPSPRLRVPLLWAFAFLVARLFALATESAAIHTPDELYNGALAFELAAGRGLTPMALNAHAPYCGGPILLAWIAAPLFHLAGPSLLALRLPSLLLASAMAGIWVLAMGRLFGPRAAHILGLLLMLSPPQFTRLTLLAWANHTESTFFTAVTVLALAFVVTRGDARRLPRPSPRALVLVAIAGVTAGMALFFSLAAAVHAASAAFFVLVLARAAGSKSFAWLLSFGAGTTLGLVPAALLALGRRDHGVTTLAEIGHPFLGDAPRRIFTLLTHDLRHFVAPDGDWPRPIAVACFLTTMLALVTLTMRAAARLRAGIVQAEWLLLLPVYLFAVAYALTSFPMGPKSATFMGYRYLAVITPSLLAVLARALSLVPTQAGALLALALVIPNVAAAVAAVDRASDYVLRASPQSYQWYGIHAFETLGYELAPVLPVLRAIEPASARRAAIDGLALRHVAHHFTRMPETGGDAVKRYVRELLPDPPEREIFLARLVNTLIRTPGFAVSRDSCEAAVAALAREPLASELDSVVMALVAASTESCEPDVGSTGRFLAAVAAGRGARFARLDTCEETPFPPEARDRESFFYGYGYGRATRALTLGLAPARQLSPGTPSERSAESRGVAAALNAFEGEDPVRREVVAERAGLLLPPHAAGCGWYKYF